VYKTYQFPLVNSLALGRAARGALAEAEAPVAAPIATMAVRMKLVCMVLIGGGCLIFQDMVDVIFMVPNFCFVETISEDIVNDDG
jgi:hypothetical protein